MCVTLLSKFLCTKSIREKVGKILRPLNFFLKAQNEQDSVHFSKNKASQLDRHTKAHNLETDALISDSRL